MDRLQMPGAVYGNPRQGSVSGKCVNRRLARYHAFLYSAAPIKMQAANFSTLAFDLSAIVV
jgi:hypothetical protein